MQTNKNLVRVLNIQKVLQQIYNYGPISRSQISKNLKLNKVTVSDIVLELLNKNYLVELGQGDSTKNGGRRPTLLEFNAHLGYVVNFDLGYNYIDCMFNSLDGTVLSSERYSASDVPIEERLNLMISLARNKSIDASIPLLGISVAIHGIVDKNKVLYTPFIDFKGLDIAQILENKLQVPVLLQNEANLSVIYERDFESHDDIDNIVCVSIHKGIGAGIILNNHLYTGKHGEAGEIGHTVIFNMQDLMNRSVCTIEELCSEDAILNIARQKVGNSNLQHRELIEEYKKCNPKIISLFDDFCFYIGQLIYNTIVTLDPKRVAINSVFISEIPELLEKIKKNIPHLTDGETQVYIVNDVYNATLLGGCSTIIHHILEMQSGQLTFPLAQQ